MSSESVSTVSHNVPATPSELHDLLKGSGIVIHPVAHMSTGYMAYYNIDDEGLPPYSSVADLPAQDTPFEISGYPPGTVISVGRTNTITINSASIVYQKPPVVSTYSIRGLKQVLSHLADEYVKIDASTDRSLRDDLPVLLAFWTALRTLVVSMPPTWFPASRFAENDTKVITLY